VANLTVVVFHDVNSNGRLDEGETPLPGWVVDVQGPGGTRLTTGPNGQAHLGPLTNGEGYDIVLVMPSASPWYPTTPTTHMWLADCGGTEFGVNQLMLPVTGGVLAPDLALSDEGETLPLANPTLAELTP